MSQESQTSLMGRCLCGAVSFTARPKDGAMHACHCELCRRTSGGVFLSVACEDDVQTTGPLVTYQSSEWAVRQFCGACGSSLFWRMPAEGLVAVSIQAFDNPGAFAFADEIYIDSKPASYDFAGDRPRLTGAEVEAMFADGEA